MYLDRLRLYKFYTHDLILKYCPTITRGLIIFLQKMTKKKRKIKSRENMQPYFLTFPSSCLFPLLFSSFLTFPSCLFPFLFSSFLTFPSSCLFLFLFSSFPLSIICVSVASVFVLGNRPGNAFKTAAEILKLNV